MPSVLDANMNYAVARSHSENAERTAAALIERRASPRRKTRFKATIVHGDERVTTPCMVVNLSETGACLKVGDPISLPADFHLIWAADQAVLKAEAVWRGNGEMGVRFVSKHDIQGKLSSELAAVCRAWELRGRSRA
jgi:hypothetical protein